MGQTKASDWRFRRGPLVATLAALGLFAGAAVEVHAQDIHVRDAAVRGSDGGYGVERAAYFQSGKRSGDDRLGGGYREEGGGRSYPSAPRGGEGGFRRGQVLPQDQRGRAVDDPGRYHLRNAPNGYGWVGDGRNAYLMQRSTGMVLDAVPRAYEGGPRSGDRGGGDRGGGARGGGRGYEGGGGRVEESNRGGGENRGREQDGGGGKRSRR